MSFMSLGEMFFARCEQRRHRVAVRHKVNGRFVDVTFGELRARVSAVAAGLLTLPGGLPAGARLSIVGSTRLEWLLADWAALSLGVITVPVYASLLQGEVAYVHLDSNVTVAVVENKGQLEKLRATRTGCTFLGKILGALPVQHIVVVDDTGIEPADDWESLAALEARGRAKLDATADNRAQRLRNVSRSDVATHVYTSGTTGLPKGVVQGHGNWLSILENASDLGMFPPPVIAHGAFLYLPLAHAFGRLIGFGAHYFEAPLILSTVDSLLDDLLATRPGFFPSAPRVFEKMYARIASGVAAADRQQRLLFKWALDVGKQTIPYRQRNKPLPLLLLGQHALADRLVLHKIRARLGLDRCVTLLSGSAPMSPAVHEFFLATGLLLLEGYGLTESCPALTANRPGKWKMGTVGPAIRDVRLQLDSDGEILAKAPNLAMGYLPQDGVPVPMFDDDGWFHTGDIGELDAEGFLRITDRKKDLLKTSGGKYVAPQKLEGMLKSKPLVAEAMVVGEGRRFCGALIVVDEEALHAWAKRTGNVPDKNAKSTLAVLQQGIDEVNAQLASFETLKAFRVVPGTFTVDNGMLTPSYKVKRKEVSVAYASLIDSMYAEGA